MSADRSPPDRSALLAEMARLREDAERAKNWKRWGPYLAERQWGTVREDYSPDGDAWNYFPHDHARSRAYRWGEDGLLGVCDRQCRLCFSLALWNGADPILKERLFGLTNAEGNHGEDVKEEYFYLDSTPTHSYFKGLYKYPQAEFPYQRLVDENRRRGRDEPEFELADTGVFDDGRYFDVTAEYAKASPNDLLIKITAVNRGPEPAVLHLLPQLFFRNTWAWGCKHEGCEVKPRMTVLRSGGSGGGGGGGGYSSVQCDHVTLGRFLFHAEAFGGQEAILLMTENESNVARLFGAVNYYPNVRDAFHDYVVNDRTDAVSQAGVGTKVGAYHPIELAPGGEVTLRLRLHAADEPPPDGQPFGAEFEHTFARRRAEADAFYDHVIPRTLSAEERAVSRQAHAGLFWSKQFYHYIVKDWLEGDPEQPPPPAERLAGRNHDWPHLFNRDVISMPDKWEYPWYAAWDLGFHAVCFARADPELAKSQLLLFLREWYMHPNGQLPAQEFNLSDVNPPVHAWACWRVYKITAERGRRDRAFLAKAFQKLLINFTWWVNRKDVTGKNIFGGGFLGLDNIGLFDRNQPLSNGCRLEQADGTAWMAFYCSTMLSMALELAAEDPVYEDVASKFFEHFVGIVDAINTLGGTGLWDEDDGFYYDRLSIGPHTESVRVRSMVGLVPLFACEVLDNHVIDKLPGFKKRLHWFLEHRQDLARFITYAECRDDRGAGGRRAGGGTGHGDNAAPHAGGTARGDDGAPQRRSGAAHGDGDGEIDEISRVGAAASRSGEHPDRARPPAAAAGGRLLAVPSRDKLVRVLKYVLDEKEFLSPFGLRSMSRHHLDHPCSIRGDGQTFEAHYAPGESDTELFGGNSNWRGPVWFPLNYLLIEALERYHHYYGDDLKVELPAGSGNMATLREVAQELSRRLARLFLRDPKTQFRPSDDARPFRLRADWREHVLFHEFFHGDTGRGLGATHQTGWTALIIRLLENLAPAHPTKPPRGAEVASPRTAAAPGR
ncbi:MAG TPA: hypothetical protein VER17_07030 [Tepidisphaeraceae bacterium]|nr:hypothetical protein [Tepidisphaeraceae bacterium]